MGRIKLDVGGTLFVISKTSLEKYPDTLLGKLLPTSDNYDENTNTYFFDRNPEYFNHILDLYRTGSLHMPHHVCGNSFQKEMEFWCILPRYVGDCCLNEYFKYENDQNSMTYINHSFDQLDYTDEECKRSAFKRTMRKLWLTLDQPLSSIAARIFNYVFMTVVILSMVSFVLGSHPDFRDQILTFEQLLWIRQNMNVEFFDNINLNNSKEVMFATTMTSRTLTNIDLFCMIFFTAELVVHFISCPIMKKFFTFPLNVLDPVLLVAMWTSYAFEQNLEFMIERKELTVIYQITKAFVVLRLFRFFRLVKIYSGLKIILLTLYASAKELFLLFISFVIAAVFFSSFVYYAEFSVANEFPTILSGIWWAIITMTTVGYGDMYPSSTYGHFVGAACAFFGILILSMPIAVVSTNFFEFYKKNMERERILKFKTDCEKQKTDCEQQKQQTFTDISSTSTESNKSDDSTSDNTCVTENSYI
ncbi:hypothetical protein FSP39_002099 [Pinctada imbricata]|uniref:BTB domain-containing protein n=1 Tax=Pinctada imbricata TaxID=66713 RepID=A0AA88XVC5_PINIB|nr:hypothetical protein FSP39_002099 [Pinctada imbricata]